MSKRVALVEFPIVDQYPLVSGYLHTYARTSDVVRDAYSFTYFQQTVATTRYEETLSRLLRIDAEIYCFSSYVWNMGLVRRLVAELGRHDRVEKIVLGGHQVSGQILKYFNSLDEKVVVVNGAGEVPFRDMLEALAEGRALSTVQGISCFHDGQLYDSGKGLQLPEPDDIPSPFLEGCFDHLSHAMTVFETNRGCPYQCSFCTWGGPTLKVTKFSTERVQEELEWIGKHGVFFLYLGDANWGMLPRDVDLSERIGDLKRRFGTPWGVYYAAAKNSPKGSIECIKALHKAGVITAQALGIQSLNDDTLVAIKRKNIKNSSFLRMFGELQLDGVSAYCELIWPLPKETLESLKSSFERLAEMNAPTVVLYPTILINNAELTRDAERFGFTAAAADDWKSELLLVTSTDVANVRAVEQGFWFYYAYFLLGNCDGHKALFQFAKAALGLSVSSLTTQFSEYLQTVARDSDYSRFIEGIFAARGHGDLRTIGTLVCHLTHERKAACQRVVAEFLMARWASEPAELMAFLALWVMGMPRVFALTEPTVADVMSSLKMDGWQRFEQLARVEDDDGRGNATLSILGGHSSFKRALSYFHVDVEAHVAASTIRRSDRPSPALAQRLAYGHDADRNQTYAHGMIQRLAELTPVFSVFAN